MPAEKVKETVRSDQEATLRLPRKLRLTLPAGSFARPSRVEITEVGKKKEEAFRLSQTFFRVTSTRGSRKKGRIRIWVKAPRAEAKPTGVLEIRSGNTTTVHAGVLERLPGEESEDRYFVEGELTLTRGETVYVGGGVIEELNTDQVFHPVPHQYKVNEGKMDDYLDTSCRRRHSANCSSPSSVTLYPACYASAWASLCSAFQMTPKSPRRRWELGTPDDLNPAPGEFGDPVSTWAAGTFNVGTWRPPIARLADWSADPTNPTPIGAEMVMTDFPLADPDDEDQIEVRARALHAFLMQVVGGAAVPGSSARYWPRPVILRHGGHAWLIVGVARRGYWAHAQNPNAYSYSDWCRWSLAPWVVGDQKRPSYKVFWPANCALKPVDRRLGSITLQGSGDRYKNVQFLDVDSHLQDVDEKPVDTINWTPYTDGGDDGDYTGGSPYVWIEGNVPLDRYGLPGERTDDQWDPDLGRVVTIPSADFGDCSCGSADGCKRCRLRLMLPVWVHNTTLDELRNYKLELFFWSKQRRWVSQEAHSIPADATGEYHGFWDLETSYPTLPGPLPGEAFEIQAVPDPGQGPGRAHPWNSQPIAWYVDLYRDQLSVFHPHGIRLVLTCLDNCLVQDVKQVWFRVGYPPIE